MVVDDIYIMAERYRGDAEHLATCANQSRLLLRRPARVDRGGARRAKGVFSPKICLAKPTIRRSFVPPARGLIETTIEKGHVPTPGS